jgi:hypothetical protein
MKCRKCKKEAEEFGMMQIQGFEFNVVIFVCRNKKCDLYGILIIF